jgi:DNA-binding MarR family transcriptional regulator
MEEENPIRAIIRTFGLVQKNMQPYFIRFGITGSQWGVLRVLWQLEQLKKPITLSQLSEHLLVQPPSVTGVVDRLERAGLVQRLVDQNDQRSRHVNLTEAGRKLLKTILKEHAAKIDSLLLPLSADERKNLSALLKKLSLHLAKESDNE